MIRGLCGHGGPCHWSNWASWCFLLSWKVRVECITKCDAPVLWLISSSKFYALLMKCKVFRMLLKCYWTTLVTNKWMIFEVKLAETSWTVNHVDILRCIFFSGKIISNPQTRCKQDNGLCKSQQTDQHSTQLSYQSYFERAHLTWCAYMLYK